ncbi:MAG: glycosyltransferase, partial [Candidatus Omnitrophica bacterium]|nr:glycosyltransferase [Candidatus Omnitrophota bacterium]
MKSRSSTSVKAKDFVSVIIPTFNAQEHLLLLLESLSNQSVKDFEVIVVD